MFAKMIDGRCATSQRQPDESWVEVTNNPDPSYRDAWYLDGTEIKYDPAKQALVDREAFKARRDAAVAAIVVEVDGMLFDGDEVSQGRMAEAILAADSMEEEGPWVLADNSAALVTADQLKQALRAAKWKQAELWVQPK